MVIWEYCRDRLINDIVSDILANGNEPDGLGLNMRPVQGAGRREEGVIRVSLTYVAYVRREILQHLSFAAHYVQKFRCPTASKRPWVLSKAFSWQIYDANPFTLAARFAELRDYCPPDMTANRIGRLPGLIIRAKHGTDR
jgi:hypothetical protein